MKSLFAIFFSIVFVYTSLQGQPTTKDNIFIAAGASYYFLTASTFEQVYGSNALPFANVTLGLPFSPASNFCVTYSYAQVTGVPVQTLFTYYNGDVTISTTRKGSSQFVSYRITASLLTGFELDRDWYLGFNAGISYNFYDRKDLVEGKKKLFRNVERGLQVDLSIEKRFEPIGLSLFAGSGINRMFSNRSLGIERFDYSFYSGLKVYIYR